MDAAHCAFGSILWMKSCASLPALGEEVVVCALVKASAATTATTWKKIMLLVLEGLLGVRGEAVEVQCSALLQGLHGG